MAFDIALASRVRAALLARKDVSERKMFGGLCFMVGGHMCCGVDGGRLMLRVGPERYDKVLERAHARPMDFTGRPLKGFVFVAPAGVKTKRQLESWLALALENIDSLPPRAAKRRKSKKAR